ncbi:hypothetical protein JVU11DRAFT_4586 [Chiua virens]|nr:hypothetical protein JVU11DRAFT_4586 [Chiua virens]
MPRGTWCHPASRCWWARLFGSVPSLPRNPTCSPPLTQSYIHHEKKQHRSTYGHNIVCILVIFMTGSQYAELSESRAKKITIKSGFERWPLTGCIRASFFPDIELRTQPRRKFSLPRQYLVQFSVGDDASSSTNYAKPVNNRTSWSEQFYFDGAAHSPFVIKVYRKRLIQRKKLVGYFSNVISGVLGHLKDGVFEQTLGKDASDASDLSGITIEFMFIADLPEAVDADQLQAVTWAAEAVASLTGTPAVVSPFSSGVDTTTKVVAEVQTLENTWGVLLDRVKVFNDIASKIVQIHPYASLAWSVISVANQVLVNQKYRDDRIIRLAGTMSDVFTFVHDAEPLKKIESHIKTMALLIQQVTECGYFIAEYAKQERFWVRMAKYTISDVDAKLTAYESKFQELKTTLLEGVALETGLTVIRMMNDMEHVVDAVDLNDLPYALGARYAPEKECLPGTRESLLREICDILNNPDEDAPRVCLLTGVAGSGKSAVAHSIARLYDDQERLGSSFCFSKADVAGRNPKNLFSTIARDLADHDPQYKSILLGVVKDNRSLRTSTFPSEHIERLIVRPGRALHTIGPLVVVVDALDESGDRDARHQLLVALSKHITERNLPTNLRFLITTRPESDILAALSSSSHVALKHMGDISDDVWAATACKFIRGIGAEGLTPPKRLKIVLRNNNPATTRSIDELYEGILGQLFVVDDAQESFREVMAIVLALQEPLSLNSLSALFDSNSGPNVRSIIKPMGSLLDGVLNEDKPIRPLHTSFRDFLLEKSRSSTFHVPILSQHSIMLGRALLACMRKMLMFNICDLRDSRLFNAAVPNLSIQVTKAIPQHLSYACRYWMDHFADIDCTPDLLNEITLFFKTHLPYWLEAISLLSLFSPLPIQSAAEICTALTTWGKGKEIAALASDTFQFIQPCPRLPPTLLSICSGKLNY